MNEGTSGGTRAVGGVTGFMENRTLSRYGLLLMLEANSIIPEPTPRSSSWRRLSESTEAIIVVWEKEKIFPKCEEG